ncbi:tripartite tricarboxylate transporter permease [Sulfitobacter sp. 20_GPM-1509m]|uniref:tripartite tricarboxylate transporter permease n=1 Tax=Sulfitobacter sp. 20_GPM-1509m TaxID=1380367 RepID=UPI00056BB638|nr:tripartite tricarboxylate transporter permease [Sulfitobacter sp. 20_GPM-1509m]
MGTIFDNAVLGLQVALLPTNLMFCFLGVFLGTILGVIPGIGVLVAISLLFPITFHVEPVAALVLLGGIYYGTTYGGSTSAILLNVPGTPSSAVACLDGYPMAQKGRAGTALFMTTVASFFGGTVGILALMGFSPMIAASAVRFGSAEYFALMVLGLIAASSIASGSMLKGIAMVLIGIMMGLVGADVYTGTLRFTFGHVALFEGVSIIALAMGIFGVSEIIHSVRSVKKADTTNHDISFKAMMPTRSEMRASWMPMIRGSMIGSFFGALPGTGGLIASYMSYATEKRIGKTETFGKGAIQGVTGPEAANNAADQTAFIPTLTLGIPGSPTMAIILGVLIIHGIEPGPMVVVNQPDLFWGLVMSFWVGNLMLLVLNIPMVGLWVRLLKVPFHLMYPAILMFIVMGVLTTYNDEIQVWVVLLTGAFGYLLRFLGFQAAPLILGFVLGPMMEEHFRRTLLLSGGDFTSFVSSGISQVCLGVSAALLLYGLVMTYRNRSKKSVQGPV